VPTTTSSWARSPETAKRAVTSLASGIALPRSLAIFAVPRDNSPGYKRGSSVHEVSRTAPPCEPTEGTQDENDRQHRDYGREVRTSRPGIGAGVAHQLHLTKAHHTRNKGK
jgi:hypothetical protein